MKFSKIVSLVMSCVLLLSVFAVVAFAARGPEADRIEQYETLFEEGIGPETEGFAIDYFYYSPVTEDDTAKYPLVIWLHGMGDGANKGDQVSNSNIANWASPEMQSRFKGSKGAYIFAPRSLEENGLFWSHELIYPLRAAIDSFIEANSANIDLSRIYIGGYSMGGKMTLKMAVAYPEMFAAAFPICPAWTPSENQTALLADMPIWLTSGKLDPLVSYYTSVKPTWENITKTSNVAENCRFSSLGRTAYSNGSPTTSSHHSWFAVTNDMFSDENGSYTAMKTIDGVGNKVELTYPEGMISWLSTFSSDFDGAKATDSGNREAQDSGDTFDVFEMFSQAIKKIVAFFKSLFGIG